MELAKTLETKVKNYLRLQSRERIALKTLLTGLSECLPETVIFGGMLREFAWETHASLPRTWILSPQRAVELRCADYDKVKFEQALAEIRALTKIAEPIKFLPELTRWCTAAGVAVVIAPAPEGCPVSGATKWLAPNKALIILTVRGKSDDKLWFTFFHEAGHLLKHGKSLTFIDSLGEAGLHSNEEAEADAFARDFLLSPAAFSAFIAAGMFSAARVERFAKERGVSAGIVVGRLQFEGYIPFANLSGLKVKYTWNHD